MNSASPSVPITAPHVLVVIVNYRAAPLVRRCLHSLAAELQGWPATRAVVVDNDSGDGSADAISAAIQTEGWGAWAELVRAEVNGGFSYGNNLAVRRALASADPPDYFWLLNPDTEVRPGALAPLVSVLDQRREVGIVGSSFEEADGTPWLRGFAFPSTGRELAAGLRWSVAAAWFGHGTMTMQPGAGAQRVDWLPGASLMVRREVFDAVGLMDEGYFLYFEEIDFCLQAARAGWPCWYVPASRVMHVAGQSTGVTGAGWLGRRRAACWFESRRRYWIKNHGWLRAAVTDALWMFAFSTWLLRRMLQRQPSRDPPRFLRDFFRHSALLRWRAPDNPMLGGVADTLQSGDRRLGAPSLPR